jgi:hypothetical protein
MLNATERRTLTLTTFASACLCFAPAEFVSGILLLVASGGLYFWDQAALRREAAAGEPLHDGAASGPKPQAPAEPSTVSPGPASSE